MKVKVEFSGGLELLFNKEKKHEIELKEKTTIPLRSKLIISELLEWLKTNKLKERPELFIVNETVRPGILVLINECDWELEGGIDYVVKDGDSIAFISTLHGG